MGLWNFLFGKRIVVPAPRPKIEEVEEIPKIVLKKERKKLLENSPKRKKPPLTEEQKKEIVGDFAKELSKRIVVGTAPREPLPPLQETKAYQRLVHSGIKFQRPPQPDPKTFINHDKIIDDIVSQLPPVILPKLTAIGNVEPICPYCNSVFPNKPKAKTKCKACGNLVYVRTRPLDGEKVLVTKEQTDQISDEYNIRREIRDAPEKKRLFEQFIENHKKRLREAQELGYNKWRPLMVLDERDTIEEAEVSGKIVQMGTEEELKVLKILCRPGCRGLVRIYFNDPDMDTPEKDLAYERYTWAIKALERIPESEKQSNLAQRIRAIIEKDR